MLVQVKAMQIVLVALKGYLTITGGLCGNGFGSICEESGLKYIVLEIWRFAT